MSKQRKPAEKTKKQERKTAIELRRRIKRKKPEFVRAESWRYTRLKENWRRPKGIDNKVRKHVLGWPKSPRIGYRGPKASRGLHPSGYKEVLVRNVDELNKISSETTAVRIAHTVGMQKRREILVKARDLNIRVLNAGIVKEEKIETAEETEEEPEEIKETLEGAEQEAEEKTEPTTEIAEETPKKPPKRKRGRKKKQEQQKNVKEQTET